MKTRLCGIALLIISLAGFDWLSDAFALPAAQRSTALEIAVAALCVPAWLFGLPMMALGTGLFANADLSSPNAGCARDRYSIRGGGN